ncbi:unnamed protein product [Symbiodinium sp. CCMP2592]|nr:unnamed protein product [Symbiodinium sp. CCMP2592]
MEGGKKRTKKILWRQRFKQVPGPSRPAGGVSAEESARPLRRPSEWTWSLFVMTVPGSGEMIRLLEMPRAAGAGGAKMLASAIPTAFAGGGTTGGGTAVQMPPVMPLPPPPSAAAAQWAQHAYTASTQAAAAKAAAAKAAEVAAAQAAAAQAAATQAQVAQVSAQQAAAAQVAQSLGYNVAPVGVPTAAAYGDLPSAAPPYGLSSPNPMPTTLSSVHPLWILPAALAASCFEGARPGSKPSPGEFLPSVPADFIESSKICFRQEQLSSSDETDSGM